MALAPYGRRVGWGGSFHHCLRLERRKVVEAAAQSPGATPPAKLLRTLAGPLPQNVAVELASWSDRGDKVVFYEGFGVVEFSGGAREREEIVGDLGDLVEDPGLERFVLVRGPDRALRRLEERLRVPVPVKHRSKSFASCGGRLGSKARKPARGRAPPGKARREYVDLVGYRASRPDLLQALHDALKGEARTCALVGGDLLVISAAALPRLRATLRRLSDRFDIALETSPARR